MVREGPKELVCGCVCWGVHGRPRFMALTSASFSTDCSQPVCHAPPYPHSLLFFSPSPPLVSCERGKDSVGGAMGLSRSLFLDAVLCQACWGKLRYEWNVRVEGGKREPNYFLM